MRIFGLIGFPLEHSSSKTFFTQKFEREGIQNAVFELFPIKDISEFTALWHEHPELKGLAVTMPYKQAVIPFLQDTDKIIAELGAVNCISIINGILKGFNTDVIGFEKSLLPLLKPNHQKALVLGDGGASQSVQWVLRKIGISFIVISRKKNIFQHTALNYEDVTPALIRSHQLIVNCTSVGMSPYENECPPIPYEAIGPDHLLYDLIYKPTQTLFMNKGMVNGAAVCNGYHMLELQAEANWEIWNQ